MKIVAVSIGNTSSRIAVLDDFQPIEIIVISNGDPNYETVSAQTLEKFLSKHEIRDIVLCSVVPSLAQRLLTQYQEKERFPIITIDATVRLWFNSYYETMETLGADRLCALIAAREEYGYPAVVIDCGTAMTINVLDANGDFVGGNILPGISTCFRTLEQTTAQLPDAGRGALPPLIGLNTIDAIRAGILWTLGKGVEGVICEIEAKYSQTFQVIVTGGDAAQLLLDPARTRIDDPHLVLKGAARYANYTHLNAPTTG